MVQQKTSNRQCSESRAEWTDRRTTDIKLRPIGCNLEIEVTFVPSLIPNTSLTLTLNTK